MKINLIDILFEMIEWTNAKRLEAIWIQKQNKTIKYFGGKCRSNKYSMVGW